MPRPSSASGRNLIRALSRSPITKLAGLRESCSVLRSERQKPVVVVVGPAPGQAGGISSVMSYLEAEKIQIANYNVVFLDTLKRGRWSIWAFVDVVLRSISLILRAKVSETGMIFHLNVSTGGSTLRKWFISTICRATLTPYVVHLHGSKYKRFFANSNFATRWIIFQLFGSAHRVIVLGSAWHEYVVSNLKVENSRVVIVANGTPELSVKAGSRRPRNKVRVVFSGRLSVQKGVPELLSACDRIYEKFQGFELVLMGDSRDDPLLSTARSKTYCSVTGWLNHDDVIRQLSSADIFTLPSHDEGLPMAMIEAMSLSIPVVVTKVGSIQDVVENSQEGFLVDAGDIEQLRLALERLIFDPVLRREMGLRAQNRWAEELEASRMARHIAEQWQSALMNA